MEDVRSRLFNLVFASTFLFALVSCGENSANTQKRGDLIAASDYGESWPYLDKHEYAVLDCENLTKRGITRPVATIQFDVQKFALNGAANSFGGLPFADDKIDEKSLNDGSITNKKLQLQIEQMKAQTDLLDRALAICED